MYNPGIVVSDAHYCHGCENYDTERANVKTQYCERNDNRSRYMEVRSTCKIYWQGVNVGAGVDGFEKNASQNTRRPSAQPVNLFLQSLFIIQFLETQIKSRRIVLWASELSEVKVCWWLQKLKEISCKSKTEWLRTWHCPKRKFVVVWNDSHSTYPIMRWPWHKFSTKLCITPVSAKVVMWTWLTNYQSDCK